MRKVKLWPIPVILALVVGLMPYRANAAADEYDESQSNPLRVVAYIVHPIGVLFEWTLARPFHAWVSSSKGVEYLYGHKPHPRLFPKLDAGLSERTFQRAAPVKTVQPEPIAERVVMHVKEVIKEVPVEKVVTVVKEAPQIIEVERVVFPDIAFEFNSTELTALGKGRAYLAAQKLKEQAELVVVIEGHADAKGIPEYNEKLGLLRAERVIKELTELGIDPTRMSAVSLGQTKPLIDQDTDWARAVNRRVEFSVKGP